ncbi:MAG: hypothetical protein LBS56_02130, partial [Propionibacteriaceae bacterium]|nr:hypothetical protein [Propionibacteriaceae bacterium]
MDLPAITSRATLNWDTATFTLPLDAYEMTWSEKVAAGAASSIVFARCATGQEAVDIQIVNSAREAVANPGGPPAQWTYGQWNAAYIAEHGYVPVSR